MAILAITQSLTHDRIELIVINHALAIDDFERHGQTLHGDNLFGLIKTVYPHGLPLHTRLYHNEWGIDNDITPEYPDDIDNINRLTGRFFIVTYPAAVVPLWAVLAISIGVSLAVAFLMPLPTMPGTNGQPPSPNNALAQRTNRQRIGGRLEDIYGDAWSVPSLIAPTYSVYIDHQEVEFSFMCIGRGQYLVKKACDDTTPIEQINGATVEVFNPYNRVYNPPDFKFGTNYTATEQAYSRLLVKRYTSVNGQVLAPPDNGFKTTSFSASSDGILTASSEINFVGQFAVGGTLIVDDAEKVSSGNGLKDTSGNDIIYNLNGEYKIKAINANTITLDNPKSVNDSWQKLIDNVDFTKSSEFTISNRSDNLWQGWFYTDNSDFTHIMINVVAPNGLYISGVKNPDWQDSEVEYIVQVQIADKDDVIIYDSSKNYFIQSREYGQHSGWTKDDDVRRSAAQTQMLSIPPRQNATDKVRFRIRRLTTTIKFKGTPQVQEVRIKDFYTARYLTGFEQSYNATTVYVKQKATEGALAVKERKLRLQVQRYVRNWQDNDNLILSNRIDDIIYDIATDPRTGGLTLADVNMPQMRAEIDNQIAYFGTPVCSEFCGTFDNTDVTTEEMIQTVAQSAFCQAYRFNNQINLHFECKKPVSVVQFNAHNMLPGSFEYSESFGPRNDYDGVQVTYTDPADDARVTLNYPADGSATNPEKKELVGVRNKTQAYMHMMRQHQKNIYAYKTCNFSGADESGIVIPTNRIDVANLHQSDTRQGVVIQQNINTNGQTMLVTNTPVGLSEGQTATIFVQTMAGIVENIRCTLGRHERELVLNRPPSQPLSLSATAVVRATFKLVTHNELDRDAYLVTAKEAGGNPMTHKLTCINYTDKYYQNDSDYLTNSIPT